MKIETVDEYIAAHPRAVQRLLSDVRKTINQAAPKATEVISYRMPAVTLDGIVVWYAAHRTHIGLYPRTTAIAFFKKELSPYKTAKGSVQFPMDEKLPLALIAKIVKFRVKENADRATTKRSR